MLSPESGRRLFSYSGSLARRHVGEAFKREALFDGIQEADVDEYPIVHADKQPGFLLRYAKSQPDSVSRVIPFLKLKSPPPKLNHRLYSTLCSTGGKLQIIHFQHSKSVRKTLLAILGATEPH